MVNPMRKTTFAALSFALLAFPQGLTLTLKPGVFVREPYACKDAPNAAIRVWDGAAFSGAGSSKCTTRVLSRQGEQFRISTTCSALGDGTPDNSGYVEELLLTRQSDSRFIIARKDQPEGKYRWCSAKP